MLVPKLRFKREDGTDYPEWEEKALSDISEIITKGTTPKKYSENGDINFVQINSIVDGAINTDKCLRIDEETHNGFLSRSVLFENDILCSIAGALGVIAVVNKDVLPANTNQALAIIRLNEGCNHRYVAFALSSYVMEKYIKQCKTVGAQPNLSLAQIRDMIVPFPCYKEQQKIADFLSAVDEVIAQSEAEVQNLEQQKKAAMQKIFSQEVRFKREDGTDYPEWEVKRMGEVCHIFAGGTPSTAVKEYWENGNIVWIPSGFVQNCILSDKSIGKKITKSALQHSSAKMIAPDTTLLAMTGATCGKVAYLTFAACANQSVMAFETESECSKYIFYLFERYYEYITSFKAGGAQSGINKDSCSNLAFRFPCLEEQQKIADFLSAYDEAISYAKQELDKWKELKKGLLQQMFV